MRGLGLGFTNPGGTWGKWDMCLCFGCGSVGGRLGPGSGSVWWCYVCVCCESGLFGSHVCQTGSDSTGNVFLWPHPSVMNMYHIVITQIASQRGNVIWNSLSPKVL